MKKKYFIYLITDGFLFDNPKEPRRLTKKFFTEADEWVKENFTEDHQKKAFDLINTGKVQLYDDWNPTFIISNPQWSLNTLLLYLINKLKEQDVVITNRVNFKGLFLNKSLL